MSDYDVIVIGGGMVGAAAAALFAQGEARVAVIEAAMPPLAPADTGIDLRVSAISRVSQRLLERLGAWQRIEADRRCPYREMCVWDAQVPPASADVLRFDAAEIGEPDLGHIVENCRIVFALHETLAELPAVELHAPAAAVALDLAEDAVVVALDDGRRLSGRLVVGADGANSRTREYAGIELRGRSYEQRAVVTHVRTERSNPGIAYQRFLPQGPIALLPLYDERSSVVWSTSAEHAQQLLECDDQSFCDALSAASDQVLGAVLECDGRAAFPLALRHARNYARPRLVLIGDAAHTVHPLAGQGVNLGFADALALHEAVGKRADPGDFAALRSYERAAKSRNLLMMSTLDGLHRLFTHSAPVAARLRSSGLGLVNRIAPVKHALIRRALGS